MERYSSWMGLKKHLTDMLCPELRGEITYFLTRYHQVHNAYGRAAILHNGREMAVFSWPEMYAQERDVDRLYAARGGGDYAALAAELKLKWDGDCTYCEMDFLDAALRFRSLSVREALESENYLINVLAVMDRRVGRRTLRAIAEEGRDQKYPAWARQFFVLRFDKAGLLREKGILAASRGAAEFAGAAPPASTLD